ncbi:MAG TPA: hypothetical protein PK052_10695 [Anaerohalosphaeraceae bacterium]|nr:hypothetical protein [Anaerohalosphaeraceae bacterium]HOL32438.1 hypothetical protein [Anaerohalosphaeraceae bacterium]HOM77342.1 hypothetical protein [Anaerohalosphaeraceae bacterium]HPC64232.1 hypothetical protein [Anaerohalosphaeraceae bacterium]HPO69336.1 hypothetical protein [Anaerohalosphaeraceae bacterium]
MKRSVVILIVAVLAVVGCGKKEKPAPPAEPQSVPGMLDSTKQTADKAVEKTTQAAKDAAAAVKESFSTEINLDKTIADLKAEAAKMDLPALIETAKKYKAAILQKQDAMKALMDKLAALGLAEKAGPQGQSLTAEIKALTDAAAGLKERLNVYIDTIKAKGGDASDLAM